MYGLLSRRAATARAYLVTARPRDVVGRIRRRQDLPQVGVLVVAEHGRSDALHRRALEERPIAACIHQARRRVARVVEPALIRMREAERVTDLVTERAADEVAEHVDRALDPRGAV